MAARVRIVVAGFLMALSTLGAALSLQGLVHPASWFGPGLLTLAVTATAVAVLRLWTESIWMPTVVGAGAALAVTVAVFAPGEGTLAPLPDLSSPGQIRTVAQQGIADAAQTAPPVLDSEGLALWISAAIALVFLLAELVAVGCRAPAWAGVVLLAPWAPAVVLEQHIPTTVFLLTAAGYLGVLVVHAVEPGVAVGAAGHSPWRSALGVVTAAVLVALVAAPAVLHLPAPSWQSPGGSGAGATRLDLGLDVSAHLDRGADTFLYSYRASEPQEVGPLHAYTVVEFTGSRWVHAPAPSDLLPVRAGEVLWPGPVRAEQPDQWLQVQVADLAQDRLLLPDQPRTLTIDGDWGYDDASDEVIGSGPAPLEYRVEIFEQIPDPVTLEAAGPANPDDVDPRTLQMPDTGHQEQIRALAERVVADAQSPYEQAVALQTFLRTDSQFTYDVQVDPARTSDAVWDFLGSGRGYCVQFASAMVMMARSLDIPARMAVGFLEGEENAEGIIEVSGHRAHTWPQLYFGDIGWVRFEPTPAIQAGAPPAWAQGTPADAQAQQTQDVPDATADAGAAQADTDTATDVPTAAPDAQGAQADSSRTWLWAMPLAALLLTIVALIWRRQRSREPAVERSWEQIQRAAAAMQPQPSDPGETPRALAGRLALPEPAAGALRELVRAVERHRFARDGQHEPELRDLHRWRDQSLRAIREESRRGAGRSGPGRRGRTRRSRRVPANSE